MTYITSAPLVIHPTIGKIITQYKELSRDPALREIWTTAFGKEFRNITQWDQKTGTQGINAMFVVTLNHIRHIPGDRVVTYANIVVDSRSQKSNMNRVRITAGGNLLKYPG